MFKRKIWTALSVLALIATPVLAAGLWPNFPIVGGAAYCSSTNTAGVPGTASVCTSTSPAGPSVTTGLETIPADTNAAGGAAPQTVKLTLASLNALPYTYSSLGPTTATNTLTASAVSGGIIIIGSASLSPTTVVLPASPIDGQQFRLNSTATIASLTVSAGSATVSNAPTALTVSTTGTYGYAFRYRATGTTWYRLD